MSGKVSWQEVVEVLERVGRGEIVPEAVGSTWDEVYAGNVVFRCGDWQITIFNDCDELDYVDEAVAPDGRRGEFDDWVAGWSEGKGEWNEPSDRTDPHLRPAIEDAFSKACASPTPPTA